ncbi:MAG: Phage integrase protein [Actinobacteria bacterium]|nr:Phage integrase protein [Actinomycetota bacterium]
MVLPPIAKSQALNSSYIIGDHILHGCIIRHTAISLLLNSGADPFAVQKLAGHSDVRLTTHTYAHVQAEAHLRTAGVLDRIRLEGEGGMGTAHRQTRHLEGVVGKPVGVQIPPSAPSQTLRGNAPRPKFKLNQLLIYWVS